VEQAMAKTGEQLDSLRDQVDALLRQIEAERHSGSPTRPVTLSPEVREQLEALRELRQRIGFVLEAVEDVPDDRRALAMAAIERAKARRTGVRASLINRIKSWLGGTLARMSDDEVLRAVEAQSPAETIAEILVATPEARASSENDWAELLLRGAEAKNCTAELVGGLLSSSEAAAVLGISVPGVKQRMERHKLLAVPLAGGQWGFPARQFDESGHVRPGVPEVVKAAADLDPWTVLSILVDDIPDGSGILLEHLDDPAVLQDAVRRLQTYGEHVAA
jgi:hypothetical protein